MIKELTIMDRTGHIHLRHRHLPEAYAIKLIATWLTEVSTDNEANVWIEVNTTVWEGDRV